MAALAIITWGVLCQKQVSRTGTSNYTPQILWDVITCPCPWYLLLTQYSSYDTWNHYTKRWIYIRTSYYMVYYNTILHSTWNLKCCIWIRFQAHMEYESKYNNTIQFNKKMKIPSAKCGPFCSGLNGLRYLLSNNQLKYALFAQW